MSKELEIYRQTQELCKLLMKQDNFYSDFPVTHTSEGRGKGYWNAACEIQEFMNGYEMHDVIITWEEQFGYRYDPVSDNEALVLLGSKESVWVQSGKNGNEDGYKEVNDPKYFIDKCYHHCTVYKRIKL